MLKEEQAIIKQLSEIVPKLIENNLIGPLKTLTKHSKTLLDPSLVPVKEIEKTTTSQLNYTRIDINSQASTIFLARLINQLCSDKTNTNHLTPIKQASSSMSFFSQPDNISRNNVANSHQGEEKNIFSPVTSTLTVK
jgi:hypothetical protein